MRYLLTAAMLLWSVTAHAAILVQSENGTYTAVSTLTQAATAPYAAGKTVVVTSALTAVQSNISSATLHAWPSDRTLRVSRGGGIGNTTMLTINGPFEAGLTRVFTGSGRVLFGVGSVHQVLAQWWGAIGDATTDCSNAFNAAAKAVDYSGNTLFVPIGQYRLTTKVSFIKPPNIVGEAYSAPILDRYATAGTVFLSEVAADYAIEINNQGAGGPYIPGMLISNIHIKASGGGSTGKGLNIVNCGWGGLCRGVVVEGFTGGGVRLSQVQDSTFDQLEILKCGTDGTYPGLYITNGCNLLSFIRPRIEICYLPLKIDTASFAITFVDAHIEQGDYPPALPGNPYYPGPAQGAYFQVIPQYTSVALSGVNAIKFIGGAITAPTIGSTMTKYSIAATAVPYYIQADSCTEVKFIGTTMGSGYDRSKILNFNMSDGAVSGCNFQFATVEDYAIRLEGNVIFTGNTVSWADVAAGATAFYGIYGEGSLVKDNYLISLNGSTTTKLSGQVFASSPGNPMSVGHNFINIGKRYAHHDSNIKLWEYSPIDYLVQDFTGTIDARFFDPHMILVPTVTGALIDFTNRCVNQQFTIRNVASGGAFNFTVQNNSGKLRMKGGVDAVLTKYNSVTLGFDSINGVTPELSRNF